MALSTYTKSDPNNDPVTRTDVDSGVGSAPAARPNTFSPAGTGTTTPAPTLTSDYGQGSQMTSRLQHKNIAQSTTVSIDPGLAVNG